MELTSTLTCMFVTAMQLLLHQLCMHFILLLLLMLALDTNSCKTTMPDVLSSRLMCIAVGWGTRQVCQVEMSDCTSCVFSEFSRPVLNATCRDCCVTSHLTNNNTACKHRVRYHDSRPQSGRVHRDCNLEVAGIHITHTCRHIGRQAGRQQAGRHVGRCVVTETRGLHCGG